MRTCIFVLVMIAAIALSSGCSTEPAQTGSIKLHFAPKYSRPAADSLYPIYPNPFNRVSGDTAILIQFAIRDTSAANLVIQNAMGDPIANFYDTLLVPGIYAGWWNPDASDGSRLANGIYFVTLQNNAFIDSRLVNLQENE